MLDIINGDFIISSDLTSGGDGSEGNDFMSDMSQENGSNDMMNDAVPDSYNNDGPGPRQRQHNPTITNNSNYPIHILDEHNHNIYIYIYIYYNQIKYILEF